MRIELAELKPAWSWALLQAYIGLGAGLASVGALLAVAVGGLLMLVGLVWYPALRLVRLLRKPAPGSTGPAPEAGAGVAAPEQAGEAAPDPTAALPGDASMVGRGAGEVADAGTHTVWDRVLHRFAFATTAAFKGLADIESRVCRRRLAAIDVQRPVFIAGLPRAGTTMLLRALAALGPFASNSYRDMPFLLTPLFWELLSRRLPRRNAAIERAQGDGVVVSRDAPEALDEVVWRAFWPAKYRADRIEPWQADDRYARAEFAPFLRSHFAKTIALRREQGQPASRYLSKNNANLGRIGTLLALQPDAVIVVPFREPRCQAASLLRQHRRFLEIHAVDAFARRYMADVGHFEFGANLRPIDFGGWLGTAEPLVADAHRLDFWLRYWCAAYGHALAEVGDGDASANIVFVSYDATCRHPLESLASLCRQVGVGEPAALATVAAAIEPGDGPNDAELARQFATVDPGLLGRAAAIHERLLRCASASSGVSCQRTGA